MMQHFVHLMKVKLCVNNVNAYKREMFFIFRSYVLKNSDFYLLNQILLIFIYNAYFST